MLRPSLPTAIVALALASHATASAQQPPALVVLLRDPSGQAVAEAQGTLLSDPEWDLPALREFAGVSSLPTLATSGARGELRFAATVPRAGAVLVTTHNGLGALAVRLLPGEAQRLELQPMGEVTTATGTEPFELWAAFTSGGHRIVLPPQQGTRIRLPVGSYEAWARSLDGWIWQRLDLVSGQRALLQFQGPAQRLERADQATVRPAGWPGVALLGPDREQCVLLGAALAAPLVAHVPRTGQVTTGVVPGPPSREPVRWPQAGTVLPMARLHIDGAADAAGNAQVYSLRRTESDGWRLLGSCRAGPEASFVLPRAEAGDDWLLVVTAQHPPRALPWSQVRDDGKVSLQRGLPLVVTATTGAGELAIDLRLDYVPDGAEVATLSARTDGRGRAQLPLLAAPGELRVSDERFANQTVVLEAIPQDGLRLVVEQGERLHGRVLLPDGSAAGGVLVTLRDPRGALRPASRAAMTAADGSFAFVGLPAAMDLVLFGTTRRDERTWSGRMAHARAGGEPVEVTLQNEDPQLGPPRGR